MIKINYITVKNFMSIGAVTQTIKFNEVDLVLVLGENLDLGGNDNRNGTGKSSILNALSYGLYGDALTNIRRENLINKTNEKNMLITVEFETNGITYRIERGRRPNIFKFIVNGKTVADENAEESENESQGDSKHTQEEINKILCMSHEMFKNIVALNTYSQPFLSMKAAEQREIIEQLLGITKLSEKAELLKEQIKLSKEAVKEEEIRIRTIKETNNKIQESISNLMIKSSKWETEHNASISSAQNALNDLVKLDVDKEIEKIKKIQEAKENHNLLTSLSKAKNNVEKEKTILNVRLKKILDSIQTTKDKKCYACEQELHSGKHEQMLNDLITDKEKLEEEIQEKTTIIQEIDFQIQENPLMDARLIPNYHDLVYKTLEEVYEHKTTLNTLKSHLEKELSLQNPYIGQIEQLTKEAIQEFTFDKINELNKQLEHQEFLLKLLTSKDSFIRKKIIDKNIGYLNHRLKQYLKEMGLPHDIKFMSDLSVEITEHGRDLDFDNLSRGERTRLILALSWSFRDVFESIEQKISLLFVDELIDNGLDPAGVESALSVLKKMSRDQKKNIFLISHREELIGRVNNVLKVIKENGFTTFTNEIEEGVE